MAAHCGLPSSRTPETLQRFGATTVWQEIVNLLMFGRCVSNTFNGEKHLDQHTTLKGIPLPHCSTAYTAAIKAAAIKASLG